MFPGLNCPWPTVAVLGHVIIYANNDLSSMEPNRMLSDWKICQNADVFIKESIVHITLVFEISSLRPCKYGISFYGRYHCVYHDNSSPLSLLYISDITWWYEVMVQRGACKAKKSSWKGGIRSDFSRVRRQCNVSTYVILANLKQPNCACLWHRIGVS